VVCACVGALISMLNDFETFVEKFSATFGDYTKNAHE
jgi:hypothetical protein